MATAAERPMVWKNGYPTTDGKPMAETDWHRNLMLDLIQTLKLWYAEQPRVYVTGNMLLFYEEGVTVDPLGCQLEESLPSDELTMRV